jgi:hypothetical protein
VNRDRTKDFGGTRFEKGNTMVVSDVNRWPIKMVGPRQTL